MLKPIIPAKTNPSWTRQLPRMRTKVPRVVDRVCQPEPERKSLTLDYVNTKCPEDQWAHAYTDGSAAEATRDGSSGVYIMERHKSQKKYTTKFKAEAEALKKKAAVEIRDNFPRTKTRVIIFTDALSVLNKPPNPRQKDLSKMDTAQVNLAAQTNLTLRWIPAHCRIKGN